VDIKVLIFVMREKEVPFPLIFFIIPGEKVSLFL